MKKPVKVLVALLVALVVLTIAKNALIQTALASAISHAAHVPVRIGSTRAAILSGSIDLKDVRIDNPRGFPERQMLHIGRIAIDAEPAAFLKNRAHFESVRLDLKELAVIKNRDGKLNVDALKPTPKEKERAREQQKMQKEQAKKKGAPGPKLQIDVLTMSIGKVVYKDYSAGGQPSVQVFDVGIRDREYRNITDPSAVVSLLMVEALTRTTLSRLADLDMDLFKDGAAGALASGLGLVGEGTQTFEDTAKGVMSLFQ
jgi:uncharacterized protein involved in outer membrane biogenesis